MGTKIRAFWLVLAFIFLTSGIAAAASPRLDSLRAAVYSQLDVKDGGDRKITSAKVTRAINRAYEHVANRLPAIEATDTVVISKADDGGVLPDDFRTIGDVFRLWGDTIRVQLDVTPFDSLDVLAPTLDENIHQILLTGDISPLNPRRCYVFNGRLYLHPKYAIDTTRSDTLQVHYYAAAETLVDDTATVKVTGGYIEPIILYSCSLLSMTRNDFEAAMAYMQMYAVVAGDKNIIDIGGQ